MKTKLVILALVSMTSLLAFRMAPKATYTVDTENSTLTWTGYHLAKSYEHSGNIQVKSGSLEIEGNAVTGGQFVIDMNSISNSDIADEKKNAKLVGHLKSDDFFAVEKFPEAKLVVKGTDDGKTTGDLTIRGITKSITFDTTIKENSDSKVVLGASIMVPRTDFEVMYGWKVENAILSGEFKLDVEITATK